MGDVSGALEDVNAALGIDPGSETALKFRAELYREMGRFDDALADANAALEVSPRAGTYYIRGLIYLDLGEAEKAIADFTYACEMGVIDACDDLEVIRW